MLDLLGVGELFGQASMLSGLPAGFTARAEQDTVCYRIPADVARGPLGRPEALQFVTRSLLDRGRLARRRRRRARRRGARAPARRRARAQGADRVPAADQRSASAAQRMTDAGATSIVVDLGGSVGIVTDRDLRTRVVAGGLSFDAPVSEAMTAPAYTVAADRLGSEVWLDMLDRGVRHFPVLSATGRVARRRGGHRPGRRRDAVVVSPAGRDRPGDHDRRARRRGARPAAHHRRAASRARPRRCTSRASTRWWSTRSSAA